MERNEEKTGFERLYETCYMRVYSYSMSLAGNRDMAQEIAQETFYRAFTAKGGFRGEANPVTWLCAIARNLYLDEMRRLSKNAGAIPEETEDSGIDVARAAADRDAACRIHLALRELEEPYRKVFEMRIFGEMSFREIGGICEKTETWARVTYHRAKLKLQERMGVHGDEM